MTEDKQGAAGAASATDLRDRLLAATAFARLVELLLDEARDVIGAEAMRTGKQRLHDMAREASKLCAVAREIRALTINLPARHGAQGDPATGPEFTLDQQARVKHRAGNSLRPRR